MNHPKEKHLWDRRETCLLFDVWLTVETEDWTFCTALPRVKSQDTDDWNTLWSLKGICLVLLRTRVFYDIWVVCCLNIRPLDEDKASCFIVVIDQTEVATFKLSAKKKCVWATKPRQHLKIQHKKWWGVCSAIRTVNNPVNNTTCFLGFQLSLRGWNWFSAVCFVLIPAE